MIVDTQAVHQGASTADTRLNEEWGGVYAVLPDPEKAFAKEGKVLAARNWRLLLNDPNIQALATCLRMQILGDGLWFRSQYGGQGKATDAIRELRRTINRSVVQGSAGTRLDAGNELARLDADTQLLLAGFFGGNGWSIRTWNQNRLGCDGFGTCWRNIDADRIETPEAMKDEKTGDPNVVNGIRYDANGSPVSIFVRDWKPGANLPTVGGWYTDKSKLTYTEVPFFDKRGRRQVIHFTPYKWRAGGSMGVPALAASLIVARQLQQLFQAHVSGKRIQASHPIIIETNNPAKASKEYQARVDAGEVMDQAAVLFVPMNSKPQFMQAGYQGTDLAQVVDAYLRSLCASVGYPFEFVMCQLTKGNMASSQAALDQAERTTAIHQDQWIDQAGRHKDESIIFEAHARGTFGAVPFGPDLLESEYQRPRRADANRLRSRQAGLLALQLGYSPSTVHDELGSDFNREQEQLAEDRDTSLRTGNVFPPDSAQTQTGNVDPSADPKAAGQQDGADDTPADEKPADDTSTESETGTP